MILNNFGLIARTRSGDVSFQGVPYQLSIDRSSLELDGLLELVEPVSDLDMQGFGK